ncbi:OPT oligopeptide transporter protein-domain-containing protein [Kockovaella imperatae]|uniref:OPT oligopeptide transporter protein-domain-containing protein n=1 Tax=Kockovaella imperatae TaxID=4999 RepID=A0A1Y1UKV0_9TREE|nr:OPT oligopeptide transporter protein-domain-containing protein [Kockovaella imperatae]ORX38167.1 OPT oligopeptide transporter protein-domain-containing protein [Kockovaella imperatae]
MSEHLSDDVSEEKVITPNDVFGEVKTFVTSESEWVPPNEWIERFVAEYTGHHDGSTETLAPGTDPLRAAYAVLTLEEDAAKGVLVDGLKAYRQDYTIDHNLLARCRSLLEGPEALGTDRNDWGYQLCKTAGFFHNWSCYAEVRAVTLPYDDVDEPCETFRAYLLGTLWVCVVTAVNTFFSQRQPGISIPGQLVQLLLVPMGRGLALLLPDWGFTFRGKRHSLNPGPWSAKEQLFSTIFFGGASTIGNFTGLLDLRMPAFFGLKWVTFGYALILAWANQLFGLGMAGILRRLTVYPTTAVWPQSLPTLALNRTLISSDNKRETINKWKISRFNAFLVATGIFIVWYWIPNQFFGALRIFNWMTWIAPNNIKLAVVTGGYGGMGFNPISTFDPLTSGSGAMNVPFFAQFQQFVMRVISGVIIIILYFANVSWGGYLPINSNGIYNNKGKTYNVSMVLDEKLQVDIDKYNDYGPPYYSISNLFITGANFMYYTFSIVYVFIRYREQIVKAYYGVVMNVVKRRSGYHGFTDGNTRMMLAYPEAPEWWYTILFLFGFVISIITVCAFPTQTPWWTILAIVGIGAFLTVPWVIIQSIADTGIQLGTIWQVLPGLWFPGEPLPQLMLLMLGDAFEVMAGSFTNNLKMAHYARMPPRAVFRGHVIACAINVVIYCAILQVYLSFFNSDSTLCQWDNPQHMVCAGPHGVYASVIQFGAFGTNNMFKLYPKLSWCFWLGGILGVGWIAGEYGLPRLHNRIKGRMEASRFAWFDRYIWTTGGRILGTLNPAIALSGALNWSGNNNLTYATTGIYIAWLFQYYLKRRYTAWWQKYAYLLFAGINVGVAISGLIGTLVFSFGAGKGVSFKWRGNTISQAGDDWKLYNSEVAYLPLPEKGYFGLDRNQYPENW